MPFILRSARKAAGLALLLTAIAGTSHAGSAPPPCGVPEIDPSSAMSAVALLSGGLMVFTDRKARKSA